MLSIVLLCCISYVNKDLNSVRIGERWSPRSTGRDPEATT